MKYWFDKEHYCELKALKNSIEGFTPRRGPYKLFFICAFSNILKPTSRWLAKSLKPQIDKNKVPIDVATAFQRQFEFMFKANLESDLRGISNVTIVNGNFLNPNLKKPRVGLVVTSPPYVISYDYADLHQLSTTWLGFAEDYRSLRKGAIGSRYTGPISDILMQKLNETGARIVKELTSKSKDRAQDVARYFIDMQKVTDVAYDMLETPGMAIFVIGNTEYKGIRIDNARHLAESMNWSGFREIRISKRKISNKQLTPFRNSKGRFTTDANSRNVYAEEFILVGMR